MRRKTFLHLTASCLSGAALSSCVSSTTAPVTGIPVVWPGRSFSSVRAFVYDCDADKSVSFFQKDGRQHLGVIGTGTVLTPDQTRRLLATLTMATPRRNHTACYVPHHAFVFYDASGQPVAHAEVCFNCTLLKSSPAGLPPHVDFPALWALLQEAGVPVGPGRQFYKDLRKARENRAQQPQAAS